MYLIIAIQIVCVAWLIARTFRTGFEGVLPVAAFLFVIVPNEAQIGLPGLFDLTTQRVITITLIFLYLSKGDGKKQATSRGPLPLRYLALLLVAWMFLSSLNSVVPVTSWKTTLSQILDFLVPYYIFAKSISKIQTVNKIVFAFVLAIFVCSIFGFFEAYWNWSILSVFPALPGRFSYLDGGTIDRARIQSTFPHAILFGSALAMAIPLALYLLGVVKDRGSRVFLWLGILLMFANIYKTASRGPWLALVMSLGLLLLLGQGHIRRCVVVLAVLAGTVLIVRPGVWQSIADLYGATVTPDTPQAQSYQWRYLLYSIAHRELSKDTGRALWGYGPESFYYLGLTAQFSVDGEEKTVKVDSCDSAVVELMMDTGYVGFLIVAGILLNAVYVSARQVLRNHVAVGGISLVLLVNLCAYCFLMTNVELFGWGQQSYMLWIIIALAMITPRLLRNGMTGRASQSAESSCVPSSDVAETSLLLA